MSKGTSVTPSKSYKPPKVGHLFRIDRAYMVRVTDCDQNAVTIRRSNRKHDPRPDLPSLQILNHSTFERMTAR